MRISLIIPTCDRLHIFRETLKRVLEATEGESAEIIVINDSKKEELVIGDPRVRLIKNNGSGVAAARNTGASAATSEILWFLDDDMWITKTLLHQAYTLVNKFPGAVFNFNWIYPPYLTESIRHKPFGRFLESIGFTTMKGWSRGTPWNDNEIFRTDWVAGATLLIPAEVYRNTGGYDAGYPLAGFEDHDFSVRLKKNNFIAYIDPLHSAYHNEVNKTDLQGFLKRTYNNAVTKRYAAETLYPEQWLYVSRVKKSLYRFIKLFEPSVISLLSHWPASEFFDALYFRICHVLIGLNIYKGFYHREESDGK